MARSSLATVQTPRRNRAGRFAACVCAAIAALSAASAQAGPPELFSRLAIGAANSDQLVLPYYFGGSGLFLSSNAGVSFALLPSGAMDPSLVREQDVYSTLVSGTGSIHFAGPTGLWTGGADGCGWTEAPELKGKWITELAADPLDPKRSYALASASGQQNGIYVNDGVTAAWTMLGTLTATELGSLHVVKNGTGKLMYERGVSLASGTIHFVIRVSEDNGTTWMEHEFGHEDAQDVRILAIDPNDPNRIVVSILKDVDKVVLPNPPDELWYSPSRGAAGSFMKVAQVGVARGAVFAADGMLYYGDDATDTPGLYTVHKLGEPAMQVGSDPISCLGYDALKKRMYACSGYEFGTIDPTSGALTPLLDKRQVTQFVECPGLAPAEMRCREQMVANYCAYGHYWQAPICAPYMLPGSPYDPKLKAGAGAGGAAMSPIPPTAVAGVGSVAGTGGVTGGALPGVTGAAGSLQPSAAAGTPAPTAPLPAGVGGGSAPAASKGGCSCVLAGPRPAAAAPWLFVAGLLALASARTRRARARSLHDS